MYLTLFASRPASDRLIHPSAAVVHFLPALFQATDNMNEMHHAQFYLTSLQCISGPAKCATLLFTIMPLELCYG